MSLSDRLAAAAEVREAVATGRPLPGALAPAPAPAVDDDVVIDVMLPPDGPVSIVAADPAAAAGSLCPTCNRPGELGLVDLPRQTTDWQCTTCGTLWRATNTAPRSMASSGSLLPPMRG